MKKYEISMLVDNYDGILNRISSLFTRRGYRINSLSYHKTENPEYSRMTIEFSSDIQVVSQITSQIRKLVDVKEIEELKHA